MPLVPSEQALPPKSLPGRGHRYLPPSQNIWMSSFQSFVTKSVSKPHYSASKILKNSVPPPGFLPLRPWPGPSLVTCHLDRSSSLLLSLLLNLLESCQNGLSNTQPWSGFSQAGTISVASHCLQNTFTHSFNKYLLLTQNRGGVKALSVLQ